MGEKIVEEKEYAVKVESLREEVSKVQVSFQYKREVLRQDKRGFDEKQKELRLQEQKLKEDHYNVIAGDDYQIMSIIIQISKETDILFAKNQQLNSRKMTHSQTLDDDVNKKKHDIS